MSNSEACANGECGSWSDWDPEREVCYRCGGNVPKLAHLGGEPYAFARELERAGRHLRATVWGLTT